MGFIFTFAIVSAGCPEKANVEMTPEVVVAWLKAPHGDRGFELLRTHFITGPMMYYKMIRGGLRQKCTAMVFCGVKGLLDWGFARNMRNYAPAIVEAFMDFLRSAGVH